MTDFTVEATVTAVTDGDWSPLRRILDLVPGTLLIEDSAEPVLIFPVQAESATNAILFVDGIAKLVGLTIRSGTVQPTPEIDYEVDDEFISSDEPDTPAERVVNEWIESVPSLNARVTQEGTVEFA
jgi:hypothetical protein